MAYQSYETLGVWKKLVDLSVRIYEVICECQDYGFKDQICRASVSIPSNVAEGIERNSTKGTIQFLHIAKGSCAEIRTQLLIALKVGYLNNTIFVELNDCAGSVSRML